MASADLNSVSAAKLAEIPLKLSAFEAMIDDSERHFNLDLKNLEELCKNQVTQLARYDQAFQECKVIQDLLEIQRDSIRSLYWRKYTETSQRTMSARDIEAYLAGEREVVDILELLLEVVKIRRKLEAIVEALKQLGWSLTNIVKLRIAQLEDVII